MVIWLTGLSGAGKSTISGILLPLVRNSFGPTVLIDGDVIREVLGNDLGYDLASRIKQISRIQHLTKFISDSGVNVLVAALYSNPKLLAWNQKNLNEYFEVYVQASMSLLLDRDTKDLYKNAQNGNQKDVVGYDIEWNAPQSPNLIIDTSIVSAQNAAELILKRILKK